MSLYTYVPRQGRAGRPDARPGLRRAARRHRHRRRVAGPARVAGPVADWALYERTPVGGPRPRALARRSGPTRPRVPRPRSPPSTASGSTGDEMVAVVSARRGLRRRRSPAASSRPWPRARPTQDEEAWWRARAARCSSAPALTPPSASPVVDAASGRGRVRRASPTSPELPGAARSRRTFDVRPASGCSTASPSSSTPAPPALSPAAIPSPSAPSACAADREPLRRHP